MQNYYVYKYIVDDEIIYVGLTNDLRRRINEHASGIGLESKFIPYLEKSVIYYHKCGNETEMSALESLLINQYKPILNVIDVKEGESTVTANIEWHLYNENDFTDDIMSDLQRYNKLLKSNTTRINNYQAKQEELIMRMNYLRPFYANVARYVNVLANNPYAYISIPRSQLPREDFLFVGNRLVQKWYDEQEMDGDNCSVQFSGEFMVELFAIVHQDNWIEKTMDMVGNNECRALAQKIANLSSTNKKLNDKIAYLKNELRNRSVGSV